MSKKDISVKKYEISKERYRELLYFCMQYHQMKNKIDYGMNSRVSDGMPHGSGSGESPVERQAIENEKYIHAVRIIEESAREASPELAPFILRAVTNGTSYEYMDVPAGRRQFYEARRKFFFELSKKR